MKVASITSSESQELPYPVKLTLNYIFAIFLTCMALGFALAGFSIALAFIENIGIGAAWLLRVGQDLQHHHYIFTLNWNHWTAAAYRLGIWITIIGVIIGRLKPLFFHIANVDK